MPSDSGLVSIIIPAYNAKKTLPRCLDSLVDQDYTNIEIIVCNDESKDGTMDAASQYAARDARIKALSLQRGGISKARNAGLQAAAGEYIMFCDSDDTFEKNACSLMVEAIRGHEMAIAHFNFIVGKISSDRGLVADGSILSEDTFLDLVVRKPGTFYISALWNKIYRADIIRDHGLSFDPFYTWGEDFAFNMEYFAHVHSVKCCPASIYNYFKSANSSSMRTWTQIPHSIAIKKHLYDALRKLYRDKGLYNRYKALIHRYPFTVTLND